MVPQTTGIVASSLQVGVDEITGALYVVWQQDEGVLATVQMAVYADGAWLGPLTFAGGDGTAAVNPQLLVFHHRAEITVDDDTTVEVSDTILHLAWWGFTTSEDDGSAFYAGVPVDGHGLPMLDDFLPVPASDLLPFGIACETISNAAELARPILFIDPQSGNPHLLATDFEECVFQLIELQYKPDLEQTVDKRRRRVVIFGRSRVMPVSRQLPLDTAKMAVGHNLSVVMYWEAPQRVDYTLLSEDSSSPLHSLTIGDDLSLDRAVDLIRTLTQ